VGAMAGICLQVADRLAENGIETTVIDPCWVKPVSPALPLLAANHRLVVTIEDNGRVGGVGAAIAQALRDAQIRTPLRDRGLPQSFLDHGSRAEVLADTGLTVADLAYEVTTAVEGVL